jgi:hypothetical protein
MGRKERHDIDYFPFFIKDGRTLFILEGKYECKGTGFFTNLCRLLSRTPDHHYQLQSEADELFFLASVKCDRESAMDMINIMVTTGKLDRDLWEQKRVLASQDFFDSIQDAYRKRTNLCITIEEIKGKYKITSAGNTQTSEYLPEEMQIDDGITSAVGAQTKLKKTKLNKTKEKKEVISDDEWLKSLEDNPVYRGIEVRILYGKMIVWCDNNGKKPTRRRFVNWLNRAERPLQVNAKDQRKGMVTL